jgi:hypothetical protein
LVYDALATWNRDFEQVLARSSTSNRRAGEFGIP